jgi:predicted N-formylglutamate amidohydrolase
MSASGSKARTIGAREAGSFEVLPGRADCGLVILCDHASNAMPPEYGTLGLPEDQLKRHIAYDIGVEPITRALSAALGAPAVLSRFSRLLIDPNRGRDDPTLIMRLSDGAIVPGNRKLDAAEREKRLRLYFDPYHAAIADVIDQCIATGVTPVLLSLHSFTESWKEFTRPWHVGILWDSDPRLAKPLLDEFFAQSDLIVGDNEPYSGHLIGDSLWQHGTTRGLPNAIVEIRQDLIREAAGQSAWAKRLIQVMQKILGTERPVAHSMAATNGSGQASIEPAAAPQGARLEKGP